MTGSQGALEPEGTARTQDKWESLCFPLQPQSTRARLFVQRMREPGEKNYPQADDQSVSRHPLLTQKGQGRHLECFLSSASGCHGSHQMSCPPLVTPGLRPLLGRKAALAITTVLAQKSAALRWGLLPCRAGWLPPARPCPQLPWKTPCSATHLRGSSCVGLT